MFSAHSMEKLVYLAGPILSKDYEGAVNWRKEVIGELAKHGIKGLSPMRAKEFLQRSSGQLNSEHMATHPLTTDDGITARDRWDVERSGLVLFNLLGAERVSIGTMVEYGWADAFRKPKILTMEKAGNPHEHQMVRSLSDYRVESLKDSLEIVKGLFAY